MIPTKSNEIKIGIAHIRTLNHPDTWSPDTGILCKYAEISLAVDHGDFVPHVEGIMKRIIENASRSEPEFRIEELDYSSVNIQVLIWHPKDDGKAQPILLIP